MVDPTPKATPPSYLAELHPRQWVEHGNGDWRLADDQRDWGGLHFLGTPPLTEGRWIAVAFPGNGRHEYMGTFKTVDEAKVAVERRLAPHHD